MTFFSTVFGACPQEFPPTFSGVIYPSFPLLFRRRLFHLKGKKGVADPEGKNTKKTLEALGFEGIGEVKAIKTFVVELDMPEDKAVAAGEEMCRKLLANPVIQNYSVTVR